MEKQYQHIVSEQSAQGFWRDQQIYELSKGEGDLYSIDTPPPTVSGSLHIGHIFSYTQTDIIARYKRLKGFRVFYPFGFDDNGLPTERYVEKKRGIKGSFMARTAFIAICTQESKIATESFTHLWQKMGISADWTTTYSTISPLARKISQQLFITLLEKGLVYRAQEVALYCTNCQTSVSQAELDDKESGTMFNMVQFTDSRGNPLTIGTTRPELLVSCVALFFNPVDTRYQHLLNTQAVVPIYNVTVPILADERVLIDKGTGLVMCCTFGDKTDIEWFKQYNLPYKQAFDKRGRWLESTGILSGLNAHDARKKILQTLQEVGALGDQKSITHAVNVHERCGTPIEYVMLPQWFVRIIDHKQTFLDAGEQIAWYPEYMKSRYRNWVENIGWDWCISRQRFYGVPFPVWHCADCKHMMTPTINELPIDPQEQKYEKPCSQCGSTAIIPDTDVMDTWNTSSITPYICQQLYREKVNDEHASCLPMSMRPQAHDIIRTWAFDTIVKSAYLANDIPWETIVISGHVLSGAHEKISKSKENNAMSPLGLLERYPADAIRYWTASGILGTDISFSESQIKIGMRLVTKLWNAFRFIKEQVGSDTYATTPGAYGAINEWLLDELYHVQQSYHRHFNQYEGSLALQKTERFFWHYFCDQYLELIKHQLFNPDKYSADDLYATKWTLYHVGYALLQFYAPFVPHITETLYQDMYRASVGTLSLHITIFGDKASAYPQSKAIVDRLMNCVALVRKIKTEKQLSLKTPLRILTITCATPSLYDALCAHEILLCGVTQSHTVVFKVGDTDATGLEQQGDEWFGVVYIAEENNMRDEQ